jgi:hypothetical protein
VQDITAMSSKRSGFTGKRVTAAFDEAKLGIFGRDFTSNQIIWSQRHQELWGYHAGEFHGNSADFTSRLRPEDLWRIEPILPGLAKGESVTTSGFVSSDRTAVCTG